LKNVSRIEVIEKTQADTNGWSNKWKWHVWVDPAWDVAIVYTTNSIKDGSHHNVIDSYLEDQSIDQNWNFAYFEYFDFAHPIEQESLSKGKDQKYGLKLTKKESLHNVR